MAIQIISGNSSEVGTVKGGSTAPIASDPSFVVTISPNSPAQAVTGTVTANIGSSGSLALDATLTAGTQKAIVRGGAKGATVAADVTSTAEGADHNALDVQIYSGGAAVSPATDRTTAAAPFAVELSDGAAFYTGVKTGQLPSALVGGRVDANTGAWLGSTAPTVGSKTSANSVPVVIASDQGAVAVSGTVTGNQGTANSLANKWPVQVTDGTNTMPTGDAVGRALFQKVTDGTNTAAVKAASTAVLATDPAVVVAISPNSTTVSDLVNNGTITSTQAVSVNSQGRSTVAIVINGTWGGTIQFQGSFDGAQFQSVNAFQPNTFAAASQTTANGMWIVPCSGFRLIQVIGANVTSGTATILLNAATGVSEILALSKITDGTNVATVKAASTAAAAADPALVVTQSPNSIPIASTTGTMTNVASSASSVTLLSANTARRGATIANDSTSLLYVVFGTTASLTNFTVQIGAKVGSNIAYYEVPFGYQGRLDGIWPSANGFARVTEIT